MISELNIGEEVRKQLEEALRARGRVNVLVAGRTGVGKSSLVNAVFGGDFAKVGQGRPITREMTEISKQGVPLRILDTRGLEQKDYEKTKKQLLSELDRRQASPEPDDHVHVAWLCVSEDSRRVEESESDLCELLHRGRVPTIGVVTKARQDMGFAAEVRRLLPEARNVIRVRALREELDDGPVLEPKGLEDLVNATMELVPEGQKQAFAAAQHVDVALKRSQAHVAIGVAVSAAAGVAATPIPFSHAVVLVPIQVGMLAKITATYGLPMEKGFLMTLAASTIGGTAGALGGRALFASLLKLIPGGGSIAGGAIAAATAGAMTTAIGMAYIAAIETVTAGGGPITPERLAAAFKREIAKRRTRLGSKRDSNVSAESEND